MSVKYQKLKTYYDHGCLENFLLIFFLFYLQLKILKVVMFWLEKLHLSKKHPKLSSKPFQQLI